MTFLRGELERLEGFMVGDCGFFFGGEGGEGDGSADVADIHRRDTVVEVWRVYTAGEKVVSTLYFRFYVIQESNCTI